MVRSGGYIYVIAPHMERTFDKDRTRTTLAELIERHETGIGPDPYAAHCSVWITQDFVELVNWLGWEIIEVQDVDDKVGNGFAVAIRVHKDRKPQDGEAIPDPRPDNPDSSGPDSEKDDCLDCRLGHDSGHRGGG